MLEAAFMDELDTFLRCVRLGDFYFWLLYKLFSWFLVKLSRLRKTDVIESIFKELL